MTLLAKQRCFHHDEREASARCPDCGRFFCRECIVEHDDRVLCASCIARLAVKDQGQKKPGTLMPIIQICCGVLIVWLFFSWVGSLLLVVPDWFHEGAIWQTLQDSDVEQ